MNNVLGGVLEARHVLPDRKSKGFDISSASAGALQAMAKLKEMEGLMNELFEARSDAAGNGLVVLPGVVQLLRALQASAKDQDSATS